MHLETAFFKLKKCLHLRDKYNLFIGLRFVRRKQMVDRRIAMLVDKLVIELRTKVKSNSILYVMSNSYKITNYVNKFISHINTVFGYIQNHFTYTYEADSLEY